MKNTIYHFHHIIPKHMGGTDDLSNLIRLTVEEHAEAHRKLYEEHGNKFDYIAYMALSNQIGYEEANYLKTLGPKNWTKEGLEKLSRLAKERKGEKNPFYSRSHTDETKAILREKMSGENSWIKGIDPKELSYTKQYVIEYVDGTVKEVYGLKIIAEEFDTSIANLHATMGRIKQGKIPTRGKFKRINIYEKQID